MYNYFIEGNEKYGNPKDKICKSVLGCDESEIRENVIIAPWWEPCTFENVKYNLIVDGSTKVWDCTLFDKKITYIKTGIGASVCTDAIFGLGNTKCKKIIFIGSAGALDPAIRIGDIMIPNFSICGDGVCRYLEKDLSHDCFGEKYYPNDKLYKALISNTEKICGENNVKFHLVDNFSVETIFAQFSHLDTIINLGCKSIEMETASAFKAASICNKEIVAIFSVSDNSIKKKSLYNGRTEEDQVYRKSVRSEIIPQIINSII